MRAETLSATMERSALAEVTYLDSDGRISFSAVTPLLLGTTPCLALPLHRLDLARALGASPSVGLVLSDSRLAYKGWSPLVAIGRIDTFADLEGEVFRERLFEQELRKFPPARRLIDSPLLQRENWWYLPRVIALLVDITAVHDIERREPLRDGILVWRADGGIDAETVQVEDWSEDRIKVPARRSPSNPCEGALFSADFTIPDLDRRAELLLQGTLDDGAFEVAERSGSLHIGPPPGVRERLRAFRALEQSCKEGLRKIEGGRAGDLIDV